MRLNYRQKLIEDFLIKKNELTLKVLNKNFSISDRFFLYHKSLDGHWKKNILLSNRIFLQQTSLKTKLTKYIFNNYHLK